MKARFGRGTNPMHGRVHNNEEEERRDSPILPVVAVDPLN